MTDVHGFIPGWQSEYQKQPDRSKQPSWGFTL
jgi:hypothetical protein